MKLISNTIRDTKVVIPLHGEIIYFDVNGISEDVTDEIADYMQNFIGYSKYNDIIPEIKEDIEKEKIDNGDIISKSDNTRGRKAKIGRT